MHLEVIGCHFTASAVAGSAAIVNAGDSFTIKNGRQGAKIALVDVVAFYGSLGELRVVGPHMNDTTEGIRMSVQVADPQCLMLGSHYEPLYPQDALVVTMFGTAAAGEVNVAALVVWYEDLPGISARLIMPADVRQRGVRVVPVRNNIVSIATGLWGGAVALNVLTDLLKPNTDYAVLGGVCSTVQGMISIRSPDWGNVRVGIPGKIANTELAWDYFARLSDRSGLPCIPIFNSGNKAATFVESLDDETATAVAVHWHLVELAG